MDNEKLYFLRSKTQERCGFLYNGETIVEGVTCPVNVDKLVINISYVLSSTERSGLVKNERPLKIKILSSSYERNRGINIAITTVSGKKLTAMVNGLIAHLQGEEIVLVCIDNIQTKIDKE
jgi:hypothetical protein